MPGRRVVIINSDTDPINLYELGDEDESLRVHVPAQGSTLIGNLRALTRRSANALNSLATLDSTRIRSRRWRGPSTLCWGATYDDVPHQDAALGASLVATFTGDAYALGSDVTAVASTAKRIGLEVPSAAAVAASSIGDYTVDVRSEISSGIDAFLHEDVTLEINYEQPLSADPLDLVNNVASTIDLINATSAVHNVTLSPVDPGMPGAPVSSIAESTGTIAASDASTGGVDYTPPSLASDAQGLYYLTIELSAATPVTILNSQLVDIQ